MDLDNYSFYDLLVDLTTKIKGLKRLRISSIEMSQVSDEIIELIGRSPIIEIIYIFLFSLVQILF